MNLYSIDFEYDGRQLSDYGFVIGEVGGAKSQEERSVTGEISFSKVKIGRGKKHILINGSYGECLTLDFNIVKNPDIDDDPEIKNDVERDIARWLVRESFHKLRFIKNTPNDEDVCYYNASFNMKKICLSDATVGFHLTAQTDSPFGYGVTDKITKHIDNMPYQFYIDDKSDEVGYVYPDVDIVVFGGEEFTLENSIFTDEDFSVILPDASSSALAYRYMIDGASLTLNAQTATYAVTHSASGFSTAGIGADADDNLAERMALVSAVGFGAGRYRAVYTGTKWTFRKRVGSSWLTADSNVEVSSDGDYIVLPKYGIYFQESSLSANNWIEVNITVAGYVAGNKELIEMVADRLTAPGIGKEQGANFNLNNSFFKGIFMAPNAVKSALKTAIFSSNLFLMYKGC